MATAEGSAGAAVVQQQLFPPPPDFFTLYGGDAPPSPPKPPEGEYTMFGEIHSTEDGLPPLRVRQLYEEDSEGRVDFRAALLALHAELVAAVQDLLVVLTHRPSAYARSLEAVGLLMRNMSHLARVLRPHQARATLAATLRAEAETHRQATRALAETAASCDAAVAGALEVFAQKVAAIRVAALEETGKAAGIL